MPSADRNSFAVITLASILFFAIPSLAQSTSQEYPTPVTTNEVSGTIKPRDIGDSRVTSYYYQFDGSQGDLFINIVTRNFTGDIDVFIQNGLRPLTKIVVYADFAEQETGRVLYLRKPEKMILRVQGRTPGDEAAQFRIKFAGSFVASTQSEPVAEPALPSLTAKNESGIRVNSVGTIVEVIPKATPTPKPVETAVVAPDERAEPVAKPEDKPVDTPEKKVEDTPKDETPADVTEKKVGVVITDNFPEKTEAPPTTPARTTTRGRRRVPPATTAKAPPSTTTRTGRGRRGRTPPPVTPEAKEPDPLEKVNLVILFKDGTTIARPMSEVLRFTVDKGVLTVVAKDGSIGRYSILDVAKVTIE